MKRFVVVSVAASTDDDAPLRPCNFTGLAFVEGALSEALLTPGTERGRLFGA